jgi:hypothetical protein
MKRYHYLIFILLVFFAFSCYKSEDFQLGTLKVTGDYRGGFALALGTGDILFTDLQVPDTSNIDHGINLPWWGQVPYLPYSNKILFDATGLLGDVSMITSFTLRIITNNSFPIGGNVQIYFVSDNGLVLDSILTDEQNKAVNAATIDGKTGEVIEKGYKITDILLDENEIGQLNNVKKIFIDGRLNNKNADTSFVKFYPEYDIEFKLSAKVETNYRFN